MKRRSEQRLGGSEGMSQTHVGESISGQQGCGPKAGFCSVFKESGVQSERCWGPDHGGPWRLF